MSNTTQTDIPVVDANHLGNVNQPTANNDWWICRGVVPMDFIPINPLMTVFHDDHLMDPMVHLIVLTADLHMESTSYISSKSNY